MRHVTLAILIGWFLYSWKIALVLEPMCWIMALFYAGALEGGAQEKVNKAFSMILIVASLLMVGVVTTHTNDNEGMPKMCAAVEC